MSIMQRIYTVFIGLFLMVLFNNIVLANTEIVEITIEPSLEMNFLQGLGKEEIKTLEIAAVIEKLAEQELISDEVAPNPKAPIEIVFPQVVIDDVIVYLQEQPTPTTFAIGDKQYCMNTPPHLLSQQSPG